MKLLKDPADYARELRAIFGSNEIALDAFNEARNSNEGHIHRMPQEWCVDVARNLQAYEGEGE